MVVARSVVDFIDGINHIYNILHGNSFVGTEYHRGLAVVANPCIDDVGELDFVGRCLVNEVLELFVHVNGNGLLGYGLAAT